MNEQQIEELILNAWFDSDDYFCDCGAMRQEGFIKVCKQLLKDYDERKHP